MEEITFDSNFLFGSATAPVQVEGHNKYVDWNEWSKIPGKTKDGANIEIACDQYNRYEEDFKLLKELGHNTHRLGIAWSRFFPDGPAAGNFKAIDHYRKVLGSLNDLGIKPMVTLFHFDNPIWLMKKRAWERGEETIKHFLDYVRFAVENLGDLCNIWITINEPMVYVYSVYLEQIFPLAKNSPVKAFKVLKYLSQAHVKAYELIHEIHNKKNFPGEAKVGVAKHCRNFDPFNTGSKIDSYISKQLNLYFNHLFNDAVWNGVYVYPFISVKEKLSGPDKAMDFYGLNYYTRDLVQFDITSPSELFLKMHVKKGGIQNDMEWEIYPYGFYRILKEVHDRYKLPVYVTENGLADGNDKYRPRFILNYLSAMKSAIDEGVDIKGYYHWSAIDNFEWEFGYEPRFGLIEVNYENQERTPRQSAKLYQEIIESKAITEDIYKKFVPDWNPDEWKLDPFNKA